MTNKFDELLTQLGTGKWSYLYFLMVGYHFFWVPTHGYNAALIAPQVDYTCRSTNNAELSSDSCFYYVNTSSNNSQEHTCTSWIYDNSTFASTLTSEFNLVCDKANFRAYYTSAYMMGNFIGNPIAGVLGDRIGRKKVTMAAALLYCIGGILIATLPSLTGVLIARAFMGLAQVPNHYILMMEVCEPKWRSLAGIASAIPWAIGTMTLGATGYLLRDWRDLQLAMSIPILFVIPIIWLCDESPRWLIVNGRHGEALKVLRRAARLNKSTLPAEEELMELMYHIQREAELFDFSTSASNTTNLDNTSMSNTYEIEPKSDESKHTHAAKAALKSSCLVCSSWTVGKISIIMFIDFLVASMVFYGLSINGTSYSDNPYIYMVLIGLVESPGYIFGGSIVSRFGRRAPSCICFLISGTALLVLAFIPTGNSLLVMGLALLGKLCISAAFQMIFLYVTELFPTIMRQQGMGYSEVGARSGSFISPLITEILSREVSWGPAAVFGGSSLVAGALTFLLHETNKVPLPDTIQDLKEIIAKRKMNKNDDGNASSAEKDQLNH
ncbi:unnamed protein product [Meganyctiphanes norvegica]|uniref:Major facilitator superfamily (MFS) profile domain-containing protein n=1 Tax=Meganyctiphanes norvegica TaxID=48144 RepID=A0AAV2PK80_MEGNR